MARILVVDDQDSNRDLITTLARHLGHATTEAADGAEALAVARTTRPDLVICDILMPTMDGYEFVRRLRADPEVAATNVIFYTANYHEREARSLAASLGVATILNKPCEPQEVVAAIGQALETRAAAPPVIDDKVVGLLHRQLLTGKLAEKAAELERANSRLEVLTGLNLDLAAVQECQELLAKVCRGARELIGARYAIACVQVSGEDDRILFQAAGMTPSASPMLVRPDLRAGLFGEVMANRAARRFSEPGDRGALLGLPSGYPPVTSGLIVPVASPHTVYGWVCLMDKIGAAAFSDEDQWLTTAHAAQFARVLENQLLSDQLHLRAAELGAEVRMRRRTEEMLVRTSRARRVMAECNRVLVRATDEQQLLSSMCRTIVVEAGDYRLAWIGLARDDAGKTIDITALEGDTGDCLAGLSLTWDDSDGEAGPIGRAVRSGMPQTERALSTGAGMPAWRATALRCGHRAIAALPLSHDGETMGVLCILSSDAEAFDADEIDLLSELADDIAFGMHTLRARTRQRQTELVLKRIERRFQATFEQSAVGIAHLALDGRFLRVNDKICALLATVREELLGRTLFDVTYPDDVGSLQDQLDLLCQGRVLFGAVFREHRYWRGSGRYFWGDATASMIPAEPGDEAYIILVLQDITDRKGYEAELEHQSKHDALTGLANRSLLRDRMDQAILFAQRSGLGAAVVLLDLDRFKVINDAIGHGFGDELLKEVARRLAAAARPGDTVARLGGDEFMIIVPEVSTEDSLLPFLQTLLRDIARPFPLAGQRMVVTASLGVSFYPKDADHAAALFKNADVAMYRAKERGRNGFQFYAPDMNDRVFERLKLESGLRHALDWNELELFYQPKVDLKSGQIAGAEALIRWRHPDNGLIAPSRFIPLAEDSGLIGAIGAWVIAAACAQVRLWEDAGLPRITVAVNVSARQFQDDDFAGAVARGLQESGVCPSSLLLELTESAVMNNPDQAEEMLSRLRTLGVGVSLDDFGTGYSSLSYLKRFSIDSLKIDQSFVREIPGNSDDAAIAVLVIDLAHSLRLSVIAEGVETQAQLDFLRRNGCDEIQGYIFSQPLSVPEFTALLTDSRRMPPMSLS
jgi:diguanylate cyclase (GGDEF)-like protein/PAS domain S-box-containing protein